jgi:hypothetical protein
VDWTSTLADANATRLARYNVLVVFALSDVSAVLFWKFNVPPHHSSSRSDRDNFWHEGVSFCSHSPLKL